MAIFHWQDAKLFVNEFDLSVQFNALKLDYTVEMLDETALGGAPAGRGTRIHKPGLWDLKLAHHGFVDFTDGALDDELHGTVGAAAALNHTIIPFPTGALGVIVDGDHAYFSQFKTATYSGFQTGMGELAEFDWEAVGVEQLAIGRVSIDPVTPITGIADGSAYEFGNAASFTFGGNIDAGDRVVAMVHILADDFTDLDIILESDDVANFGGTPATLDTVDNSTGVTSFFMASSGAAITDDFFRLRVTAFTGTSATVLGVIGVMRGRINP